jgi:hypothetical protein
MSGYPHHGWSRLAHSILVPIAVIVVLAALIRLVWG